MSGTARGAAGGAANAQAVLALARRRVNMLWALLPDNRPYQANTLPLPPDAITADHSCGLTIIGTPP
ncbi:MAG TPA: hypothetical protein VIV12_24280 [Streptosporangiaceae bacterium]